MTATTPDGFGQRPRAGLDPARQASIEADIVALRESASGPVIDASAPQGEDARSPFAVSLGQRLRLARQRRKLSLQGVEQASNGRFKAVVIGSYERGDRAVTVQRLVELAAFYDLPAGELIPDPGAPASATRIILDLERLTSVPRDQAAPLVRYAQTIQAQRGDGNARSLPIRVEDLRALAVIYDASPRALTEQLIQWGVVSPEARSTLEAG